MIGVSVLVPTALLVAANPGGDRSAVSGRLRGSAGRGAWIGAARVVCTGRAFVRAARFGRAGRTLTGGSATLLAGGGVTAGVVAGDGEGVVCAEAIGQSAVVPNATVRHRIDTRLFAN
jgi:hypothetical protein